MAILIIKEKSGPVLEVVVDKDGAKLLAEAVSMLDNLDDFHWSTADWGGGELCPGQNGSDEVECEVIQQLTVRRLD